MRQPSIRRTLLIRCGIGVGVLLCLLSLGVYQQVKQSLYREVDQSLEQTASLLANEVELEDGMISFEWKEGIGTNNTLIENGFFQFWNETTGVTTRSPGLRVLDLPKFTGPGGDPRIRSIELPNGHRAHAIGLRIFPFVLPEEIERMKQSGKVIDPKSLPHILVVARDSEPVHHTLARLREILAGGSLLTLALGFLLIARVVGVTLRPILDLTLQMRDRSGHQLDSALELPENLPAELSGLAENFGSLLARVAAMRERERDFIRHAAHELRTPIAGLQATTELALSQPREASSYAAYLETCRTTSVELGELVKRLTALSRVGRTTSIATRENVDIGSILTRCHAQFSSAITQRGLRLTQEIPDGGWLASGDSTLVRLILNNLLDNAVCYATEGSEIRVRGERRDDGVELRISNECTGLPEKVDRLFEPLFRKETSRSDAGSHLGIGLTLSLEAATAMGATLSANKLDNGRIEFVLRMPAAA